MSNLVYFLALNRMPFVGPRTVIKLLQKWPDLSELFKLSCEELITVGLPFKLASSLSSFDLQIIEEDLQWQRAAADNHLLCWDSPTYPALLKEIPDPPIILYAQGRLEALQKPTLAIIGSRNPSVSGSENANRFAKALAQKNITIVSGLALGIDAQAHQGCLEGEGSTIAVMGTGIDSIYPRKHQPLAEKIREKGVILTEFPLKTAPMARHFPQRNRIISGVSLSILVVEAAMKSGSLITARMALEQNRDVLAIPGSIHNPMARGCHHLLQQGAKLVTTVQDVLDEMGIEHSYEVSTALFQPADDCKSLLQFIGFETTTVDQIIIRSGATVEQVLSELAELELQGNVISIPGGYMRRIHER